MQRPDQITKMDINTPLLPDVPRAAQVSALMPRPVTVTVTVTVTAHSDGPAPRASDEGGTS